MKTSNGFVNNDFHMETEFHSLHYRQPPPDRQAQLRPGPHHEEYQHHETENVETQQTSKS